MSVNVGVVDRALRVIIGLALIAWALGYLPGATPSAWGWIGVIPIATAFFGFCPAYALLGASTCPREAAK